RIEQDLAVVVAELAVQPFVRPIHDPHREPLPIGRDSDGLRPLPDREDIHPLGGGRVISMMLTLSVSPEFRPMLPTAAQRPFGAMATARGFDPTAMSPVRGPLRTSNTSRSAM